MSEKKETPDQRAKEMFEQRETWCAVERMKEEAWCRKNRQHYSHHLESHLFEETGPSDEPRCTFEVNAPTHLERRHFPSKHLVSQWTTL